MHRLYNQQKGYTLVEVIVSLALLGLITAYMLPLLTSSFATVKDAGVRNRAHFNGQGVMEKAINELNLGISPDPAQTNISIVTLQIGVISAPGRQIIVTGQDGSRQVQLTTFVANKTY